MLLRKISQVQSEKKKEDEEERRCFRCGFAMFSIQSCHLRCENCGSELTCSDKGLFW